MQQIIQIDKIEDGMVLAEPVLNQFSQVLLPSGTVLSSFHTNILKKWNISYIFIYIENDQDEAEIPQELINDYKELIKSKLLWTPIIPVEEDLINIAARDCAENKFKQSSEDATN